MKDEFQTDEHQMQTEFAGQELTTGARTRTKTNSEEDGLEVVGGVLKDSSVTKGAGGGAGKF